MMHGNFLFELCYGLYFEGTDRVYVCSDRYLGVQEKYSYFWKLLHNKDDSKNRTSWSDVPFWCNVENAFNKCVHELFVTGMEGKVQVQVPRDSHSWRESAFGDMPQTAIKQRRLYSNPPADNLSSNELEVRSRRFDCTGIPVKCVNPALLENDDADPQEHSRHLCAVCGKATPWFCVECNEYVCADFKDSKRDSGYYIARLAGKKTRRSSAKRRAASHFTSKH